MAEELIITAKDKAGVYAQILPQIEAIVSEWNRKNHYFENNQ